MSDLRVLNDAFAELERRADAVTADLPPMGSRPRRAPGVRLVPVAATVVAVAGLVAGAMWLAPGDTGRQTGNPPTGSTSVTSVSATPAPGVPTSTEEAIDRLRTVLDGTATFDVTRASGEITDEADPTGMYVEGLLTAGGVTGGFDLGIGLSRPTMRARCDKSDECVTQTLPDGSLLAAGRWLPPGGGVIYEVDLVRSDGVHLNLHVTNQRTPRASSEVIAAQPPLTTDQMVAILVDDRW